MINVVIGMRVSTDKRHEVLDTFKDLLVQIRREQDCVSCHCYLDVEAEEVLIFEQEWNTRKALAAHFRSGHFKVLRGVMKMLCSEPEIRIATFVATEDQEAIASILKA
jgi:quinol monooxygenase YgiN